MAMVQQMTQRAVFRWHHAARLSVAGTEIARPNAPAPHRFHAISGTPTRDGVAALSAALSAGDPFCVAQHPLPDHTTAPPGMFLTLTGGSTASPKIIRRSMASWIASVDINARQFGLTQDDTLAVLGALSHSLALYGVVEGLYVGLNTHVLADLSPAQQRQHMQEHKVSVLYATPTQLRLLCRGAHTSPGVRLILCGGGALDPQTALTLRQICPQAALYQFYGAAETSFITMTDANTPPGSQGRAYPGVSLRLLDAQGQETSGTGEVWVRSPYVFEGYLQEDTPHEQRGGFISVGEIGHLDPQGNLFLTGRKSRQVTIADQTLHPEAIEAHILSLIKGQNCAVLPLPDTLRGCRLIAVLEGAQETNLAHDIRQSCRATFGALATPAQVLFIPEMPMLPSGKIDLGTLARWVEDQT